MPWMPVDFTYTKDGRRKPNFIQSKTFYSEQKAQAYCEENLSQKARVFKVASNNFMIQKRQVKAQLLREYSQPGTDKWTEALTRGAITKETD